MEAGGNWEGADRGLLKVGRGGPGGRVVETEGLPMEMALVPGRDRGLDRPETQRSPQTPQSVKSSVLS